MTSSHDGLSTWRSAITEEDGKTVDAGYLSIAWLLVLDVALSIVIVLAGFAVMLAATTVVPAAGTSPALLIHPHDYPFAGVAAALGAIWGTFSTALGALALYRKGEKG